MDDSCLGSIIRSLPLRDIDDCSRHGSHIYNCPFDLVLNHYPAHRPGHDIFSCEICIDYASPLFNRCFQCPFVDTDTRIIKENIDFTGAFHNLRNCPVHFLLFCHIGAQVIRLPALFRDHVHGFLGTTSADDDNFCTCFCQTAGNYLSNPSACSGDNGCLPMQSK